MKFEMVLLNMFTSILSLIDMDSDGGYHSESEFYHPDEMRNDNVKENIGAKSNEEK